MSNTGFAVEVVTAVGDNDLTNCWVFAVAGAAVDVVEVRVAVGIRPTNRVGITETRTRSRHRTVRTPVGSSCCRSCS